MSRVGQLVVALLFVAYLYMLVITDKFTKRIITSIKAAQLDIHGWRARLYIHFVLKYQFWQRQMIGYFDLPCCYSFYALHVDTVAELITIGVKIDWSKLDKKNFTLILFEARHRSSCDVIMRSGFQCSFNEDEVQTFSPITQMSFRKFCHQSFQLRSLQRIAANEFRSSLKPNAIVALQNFNKLRVPKPLIPIVALRE